MRKASNSIRSTVLAAPQSYSNPKSATSYQSSSSVELMRWVSNTNVDHPKLLRYSLRSCCDLDLELRPGTAMYKSGPRHTDVLDVTQTAASNCASQEVICVQLRPESTILGANFEEGSQ
jgi:hypothetical protein